MRPTTQHPARRPHPARVALRRALAVVIAALAASPGWAGAPADAGEPRLARTRMALHELAHLYTRATALERAGLLEALPLLLGEVALGDLPLASADQREKLLDYVYERCLRGRVAILRNIEEQRRVAPVASAPTLARLRLAPNGCRDGAALVLPVALAPTTALVATRWPAAPFATGEFVRFVPALNGASPEADDTHELVQLHRTDPTTHRAEWAKPAGGFLRDGDAARPPVLVQIDHPAVRAAIRRQLDKTVAAWPKQGGPLYHSLGGGTFYVDYSARSARRFIQWLQARHQSLRVVNAVWDTRYPAFGPAMMPRPQEAAASALRWADWADFNQWRLAEHVRWAAGNARNAVPKARLALSMERYLLAGSTGLSGVAPQAIAPLLDVVETRGASALVADLCSAFAHGKPRVDAAVGPGAFGVLPRFLHGAAALRVQPWPLLTVAAARDAQRACREAIAARRLAAELAALARAPAPLALLYSHTAMRMPPAWAVRCAETPYTRQLAAAHQAARFLPYGCGFVTSADVRNKRVAPGRLLIVPGAPCESDDVVRALLDRVETGAHVVVLTGSWTTDEHGHEADYLMRLGVEVTAAQDPVYTTRPRPDRGGALDDLVAGNVPRAAIAPAKDGPLAALRQPLRGEGRRETVRVNVQHDVWATFPEGHPAVVSFSRGEGRITYVAMPLGPRHLAAVLLAAARQAKLPEPLVRLVPAAGSDAWGVEHRAVVAGSRVLTYAWNTTDEAKNVSFHTRRGTVATDLTHGRPLAVRRGTPWTVVEAIELEPFQTVIVQLTQP